MLINAICPRLPSCSKRYTRGTQVNISRWKNMGRHKGCCPPPPPPYTTLKHFWKKLKLNPKLQISIAEFYALSRYYVCRCSRNIVIRFSAVSYFWELFKKPIGTDEANTLELL